MAQSKVPRGGDKDPPPPTLDSPPHTMGNMGEDVSMMDVLPTSPKLTPTFPMKETRSSAENGPMDTREERKTDGTPTYPIPPSSQTRSNPYQWRRDHSHLRDHSQTPKEKLASQKIGREARPPRMTKPTASLDEIRQAKLRADSFLKDRQKASDLWKKEREERIRNRAEESMERTGKVDSQPHLCLLFQEKTRKQILMKDFRSMLTELWRSENQVELFIPFFKFYKGMLCFYPEGKDDLIFLKWITQDNTLILTGQVLWDEYFCPDCQGDRRNSDLGRKKRKMEHHKR